MDIRLLSNNSYLCVNRYDTLTWVGMDQGGRGYFVFLLFCLEKSVYGPCWMYFCRPHRKNSQGQGQCFYEVEMNDGPKDFYFSLREQACFLLELGYRSFSRRAYLLRLEHTLHLEQQHQKILIKSSHRIRQTHLLPHHSLSDGA